MSRLLGKAVQGISTGIGLASEKYHDHKERKAVLAVQEQSGRTAGNSTQEQGPRRIDASNEDDTPADDERIWALDEAAGPPPAYEATPSNPDDVIVELARNVAISRDRFLHVYGGEISRLAHPVVIPQKRPGSKARGWTRAYAPDLEPLGIDQDAFMKFLQSWDDVTKGFKWFKTVSLASGLVGMAFPGPVMMAVTTAVSLAAEAGQEMQDRYKTNSFLDKMNREVFMPAGLYAMVILCKQDASITGGLQLSVDTVNLENAKAMSKYGLPGSEDLPPPSASSKFTRSIRSASGKANVDEMPLEIAPLIYPTLDDMVQRPELQRDENFKQRMMRNKDFVSDYFDRRAKADFAGNNPNAALTKASGELPEFKSRFADPNNACNNGHIVSLVTGGKFVVESSGLLGGRGRGGPGGGRQRGGLLSNALRDGQQESGYVGARSRSFDGGRFGAQRGFLGARKGGSASGYSYEDNDRTQSRGRGGLLQNRRQAAESQLRKVGEDGKLLPREKQPEQQARGPIGYAMKGVKKVMKPDVMYLTIVNLPTTEEMELAREALGMDRRGWQEMIEGLRRR